MTKEQLFKAMIGIDEERLEHSERTRKKSVLWIYRGAVAACIGGMIIAAGRFSPYFLQNTSTSIAEISEQQHKLEEERAVSGGFGVTGSGAIEENSNLSKEETLLESAEVTGGFWINGAKYTPIPIPLSSQSNIQEGEQERVQERNESQERNENQERNESQERNENQERNERQERNRNENRNESQARNESLDRNENQERSQDRSQDRNQDRNQDSSQDETSDKEDALSKSEKENASSKQSSGSQEHASENSFFVNESSIMETDLGEIMGVIEVCENEELIGCTVYHYAFYPDSDRICIVKINDSYRLYQMEESTLE